MESKAVMQTQESREPSLSSSHPPASEKKEASISVSLKAIEAIHRQLVKRGTPDAALRVGIRGGGCSGFTYVIEFHDGPPRPKDRVYDYQVSSGEAGKQQNVRVVVDPKSLVYLNGTVLEWEQTLMKQGFKFVNPNEKTNCGCGHSFTV
jgi:iron-sulfur cluster assembly protein